MLRGLATVVTATVIVALLLDVLIYQYVLAGPISVELALHLPFLGAWPKLIIASVLAGIILPWLYAKGRTKSPWLGQGLRFGFAVAVLTHGCMGLLGATMLSHQGEAIVVGGIGLGMARDLALGVFIAFMGRKGPDAPPEF